MGEHFRLLPSVWPSFYCCLWEKEGKKLPELNSSKMWVLFSGYCEENLLRKQSLIFPCRNLGVVPGRSGVGCWRRETLKGVDGSSGDVKLVIVKFQLLSLAHNSCY